MIIVERPVSDARKTLRHLFAETEMKDDTDRIARQHEIIPVHLPPGLRDKGNQSLFYAHTSASAMTLDK